MQENQLLSLKLGTISLKGNFWSRIQEGFLTKVLEKQWKILNGEIEIEGVGKSHCIDQFRILAGDMEKGEFGSYWFSDHELGKWMEAASYAIGLTGDTQAAAHMEYLIDLLERAQQEDGYLNTYYTLYEPGKRFTNFTTGHELLNAGNLIEAAVAYYEATGNRRLLDVSERFADLIYDTVMHADHFIYDGHEELEIALVRLYLTDHREKDLELAARLVDTRGVGHCLFLDEDSPRVPNVGLEYYQAHQPVREQTQALGHAVRATYLYTAMAQLALLKKDETLQQAAETLYRDIRDRNLYLTGGVGSEHHGERFTWDFDLPNDSAYCETCASIGLMMFSRALLSLKPQGEVADMMERALYNTVLSGVSADFERYFYVNPLSVIPETAVHRQALWQVRTGREEWMKCPCCPPNLLRLILSLSEYVYLYNDREVYLNLWLSNEASFPGENGEERLSVSGNEPWDQTFTVTSQTGFTRVLKLKKPYWSREVTILRNGKNETPPLCNGYYAVTGLKAGDVLTVRFSLVPRFVYCNPRVEANAGKIAVERGYLVYCAEETDNGKNLAALTVNCGDKPREEKQNDPRLGGTFIGVTLSGKKAVETEALYSFEPPEETEETIRMIPYPLWNNRGIGEMRVWLNAERKGEGLC